MSARGVGTSVHFIPLHKQPYWQEKYQLKDSDFPIATSNFQKIMSLPIYTILQDEQIEYIIESFLKVHQECC